MNKVYFVVETFDREFPVIVTNEAGLPLLFDSREEAQFEANECQFGIVFEY